MLETRDLSSTLTDARTTLGSWDGCMSKAYCKWPVIIAIIVGVLIIGSIIFCCARCCCFGLDCCCGCFKCCNKCCPSPRKKNKSYVQTPQQPPGFQPPQGPQPWQPQPHNTGLMAGGLQPNPPQFARFSSTKPSPTVSTNAKSGDALPSMPTWSNAKAFQEEDKTYLPPAESPPGHSALDKELGDEAIPLKDQTPSRRPTLPDLETGSQEPKLSHDARSNPVSRTQTPAGVYGAGRGTGRGPGPPPGVDSGGAAAGGHSSQRRPSERTPPPRNPYGYGPPPRRPSERQQLPQHQNSQNPHGHHNPYTDQRGQNGPDVSPVSPLPPDFSNESNHYGYQPPHGGPAPQPAYASRQAPRGLPPPQLQPPPPSRKITPAHGYAPPPRGGPSPPHQGFGPSPPQQPYSQPPHRHPSPQEVGHSHAHAPQAPPHQGGYGLPQQNPYDQSSISTAPPQQPLYGAGPPGLQRGQAPLQGGYQTYNHPQHHPNQQRPPPQRPNLQPPSAAYSAYTPSPRSHSNATENRAELGGPEVGMKESPRAQPGPVYELGGGNGVGEGGEWQRKPPGGWH